MKFLYHLNSEHQELLSVIDNRWPLPFLKQYTDFYTDYFGERIMIAHDEDTGAMMPVRLLNLRFFSPAQMLFTPFVNGTELNSAEQLNFYDKFIRAVSHHTKCERIAQPSTMCVPAIAPSGSRSCEFGSYIVDLKNNSDDQILDNFHPKYQKAVSHSVNNNAVVKFGVDTLDDFYKTYLHTMQRAGMNADRLDYFHSLIRHLGPDNICCGVVYENENPVSGIFLTFSEYSAFLTHAGTIGGSKLYGAAKLLNYEAMKYLKHSGVQRYDFVGVRINSQSPELEGIFRFKKGFGGNLKTGFLWKLDVLPMKARLMDTIIYLRSKGKPAMDIIDQENR